jgi:hypothetical protein
MDDTALHVMDDTALHVMDDDTALHAMNDTALHVMNDTALRVMNDTALQVMNDTALQVMNDTALHAMNDTALQVMNDTALHVMDYNRLQVMDDTALHVMGLSPSGELPICRKRGRPKKVVDETNSNMLQAKVKKVKVNATQVKEKKVKEKAVKEKIAKEKKVKEKGKVPKAEGIAAYKHGKKRLNNVEDVAVPVGAPSRFFPGYVEADRKPVIEVKNDSCWNRNEKTKLLALIDQYKTSTTSEMETTQQIDWVEIAKHKDITHTANECFIYYTNSLSNSINREPWTKDEELKIISLANEYEETNWAKIAEELGTNRTAWQCFSHYQQALNTAFLDTTVWSAEEEKKLAYAVESYGTKNWQHVASELPGRNAIQCNNRWRKSLESDSMIVGGHWSEEEEKRLLLAAYAHDIPSTDNCTFESRKIQENKSLVQHWASIASLIPNKDYNRIREKWTNKIDPSLLLTKFTREEDTLLLKLVEEHGSSNWTRLVSYFPGRTDGKLRLRWRALINKAGRLQEHQSQFIKKNFFTPILSRSEANSALNETDVKSVLRMTVPHKL